MNQWAARNPELCEQGVRYEDVHDLDRIRKQQKEGTDGPKGTRARDRNRATDRASTSEAGPADA